MVGLVPGSRWAGGSMNDSDGVPYLPNIPTEEVFTSPDRRRADGTISLTKPVIIGGQVVEGLRVTFTGGRIAGATRVYWHTHETNATARRLYDRVAERSGFIVYRKDV